MTEQKENANPAEAEPNPAEENSAPPPRERSGGSLGAIALLIAVVVAFGAAIGGYYLWQRFQELRAAQAEFVSEARLDERLAPLVDRQALERALEQAQADTRTQAAQAAQGVEELRQRLGAITNEQQALKQRVERVDELTQSTLVDWIRAEAAYLAKIAAYRVRYYNDVDAALAALKTADDLLSNLGGQSIQARKALNRAIDALVRVDEAPAALVAEQLEALITQVDVLPLDLELDQILVEPQDVDEKAAVVDEDVVARLERAWERFKETLGELVVVHRDRRLEPLLVPEERYFLYHNLRLRLEAARLALIDRNEELYRRSLERAAEWIERYYARGEPEVEAVLATLRELQEVDIDPALPDIAELLAPVIQVQEDQ